MPIYDFQCTNCGHKSEVMRKVSDVSVMLCPNCQQETFAKLLSAPSFQLSGSGWYATDFKNNNKNEKSTTSTAESSSATEAGAAACSPGCACH